MPRLTKEQIIKKISSGKLLEVLIPNVELKSSWRQEYGKDISAIDEIVYWNEKAYKLLGTSSPELSPSEILSLSLELPGQDFSKLAYTGKLNSSLIMEFAEKINEIAKEKLNLNNISSLDILSNLGIHNKNVSGILFGDFPIRFPATDIPLPLHTSNCPRVLIKGCTTVNVVSVLQPLVLV